MLHRQMPPVSPRVSFVVLMLMAGLILLGGAYLSRKEERHLIPRDREPLKGFALELQNEMLKLERLYDSHLRRIARDQEQSDMLSIRRACEGLAGVEQLSVIHAGNKTPPDVHITVRVGANLPRPTLQSMGSDRFEWGIPLSPEILFNPAGDASGWIEEPGKPLMFWVRQSASERAAVFLVNGAEVGRAMNGWLEAWARSRMESLSVSGGLDQLIGPGNTVLVSAGPQPQDPKASADFLLPIRGRFGTWQLVSWDERQTRSSYSMPIFITATGLSLMVAACGLIIPQQQRHALRLAEQRVSFVNRVSHELRAPLTNILLNLDLAADAFQESNQRGERKLALVQEEARRLSRLIENVLTFSRGQQGRLVVSRRAVVPDEIVTATLDHFSPLFIRREITAHVKCNAPVSCLIDPDAFAQILSNLLSNVEKYAPGTPVEIRTDWQSGELLLQVRDFGPGISPHDEKRIFRPFERINFRVNEGSSGSGLGLTISRELASVMGGTLRLISSECGACFEVRLPAPAALTLASIA